VDEKKGQFLALGRDLRAFSALQQRLIDAQQSLERDYWRMRHLEARYRLLFQSANEAVLMIDAVTHKVLEANPAAALLFDQPTRRLAGRTFPFDIDAPSEAVVEERLATVRSLGRADDLVVQLAGSGRSVTLAMSLMRQDSINLCLVRLLPAGTDPVPGEDADAATMVFRLVEGQPDGFVVSDADGRVVLANRAFLDMAELATPEQARGRLLSEWIGRPGADLRRLLGTVSEHGTVRLARTALHGELGAASEVEISATAITEVAEARVGFVIRDIARRLEAAPRGASDLGHAVEQLTSLVGRVSLKDLVRDTTALVERHFITAALDTTRDNRSSAAELLGVSRQSLYMKLKRHELGDSGGGGVNGAVDRKLRKRPRKR
jgi:transcriptional regulator PpsR